MKHYLNDMETVTPGNKQSVSCHAGQKHWWQFWVRGSKKPKGVSAVPVEPVEGEGETVTAKAAVAPSPSWWQFWDRGKPKDAAASASSQQEGEATTVDLEGAEEGGVKAPAWWQFWKQDLSKPTDTNAEGMFLSTLGVSEKPIQ